MGDTVKSVYGWLEELKAGDKVVISRGFGYRTETIATVEKITSTQIVIGKERFRRATGYMVGDDSYSRTSLRQATPELIREIKLRNMRTALGSTDWKKISPEVVEQVSKLVLAALSEGKNDG